MPRPVFALILVVFGLTTGEFVIAGILPDVATNLSVSIPAAGLLVTAYALGMIVGGPVVTVLTARVVRKRLIVGLVAVSIIGNLGSAVAPNYVVLLLARFIAGLVVATFFAVAIHTAVSTAPEGKQASTVLLTWNNHKKRPAGLNESGLPTEATPPTTQTGTRRTNESRLPTEASL
jgi:DHA1 family inner membrane transport protein